MKSKNCENDGERGVGEIRNKEQKIRNKEGNTNTLTTKFILSHAETGEFMLQKFGSNFY
jgi:hypothetical protein